MKAQVGLLKAQVSKLPLSYYLQDQAYLGQERK